MASGRRSSHTPLVPINNDIKGLLRRNRRRQNIPVTATATALPAPVSPVAPAPAPAPPTPPAPAPPTPPAPAPAPPTPVLLVPSPVPASTSPYPPVRNAPASLPSPYPPQRPIGPALPFPCPPRRLLRPSSLRSDFTRSTISLLADKLAAMSFNSSQFHEQESPRIPPRPLSDIPEQPRTLSRHTPSSRCSGHPPSPVLSIFSASPSEGR